MTKCKKQKQELTKDNINNLVGETMYVPQKTRGC